MERALKSFSQLSEVQLNWKSSPETWSVGECLSHLVNSNGLYLNKIVLILSLHQAVKEMDYTYKQTLTGKMIAKGVDPSNEKRVKTFKVFLPDSSNIHLNILNAYIESSEKLINTYKNLKHHDLKKIKLSSPVNKLIRMNLGDPLIILPKHDKRHLNQAERVLKHEKFPVAR